MNPMNLDLCTFEGRESLTSALCIAAQEVFVIMLGSHLESANEPLAEAEIDITAMVGLAGRICGVMTIRCPEKSATLMASKMLGVNTAAAGPKMWDAAGEVCNMIAGNFKTKIAGMGDGCMLSVPTVITGGDYSLHPLKDSAKIETSLLFEGLPLIVSLEVHS